MNKDVNKEIAIRLKQLLMDLKISGAEFARRTNLPYRTLQAYLNAEICPTRENLSKLQTNLRINPSWLLTGEGEMFLPKPTSTKGRLFFARSKQSSKEDEEAIGVLDKIVQMLDGMPIEDLRDIQKHIEKEKRIKELENEVKELKDKSKCG